jgi:hypothetical protein
VNTKLRFVTAALAAWLAVTVGAFSQEPHKVKKVFTKNTAFRLPVQIDDAERAHLNGLKFFVRAVPGNWECKEVAAPNQTAFTFRAPQDGEYWFNFSTVDKNGTVVPGSPEQEPPGLVVVVDTKPPEVELRTLPVSQGQVYLSCVVRDENPDYATLRVEYAGGTGWVPLAPLADTPGVYQVPNPKLLDGKIHIYASDKAGNIADKVFDSVPRKADEPIQKTSAPAGGMTAEKLTFPPPSRAATEPAGPVIPENGDETPKALIPPPTAPAIVEPTRPAPLPANVVPDAPLPPAEPDRPVLPPAAEPVRPLMPATPPAITPTAAPEPDRPIHTAAPGNPPLPGLTTTTGTPHVAPTDIPLINSRICRLEYSVEPPFNGIPGPVEIWGTLDGSKSWVLLGIDKDGRSPAEIELPNDGTFGLAFTVNTSTVAAGIAPKPGEKPDSWLEIDTMPPEVKIVGANLGTGQDQSVLFINWTASDKNMGHDPVAISCSSQPLGPWAPIARSLPNNGMYRWKIPQGLGSQVYLRLEVMDRAGNVARAETRQPITIEPVKYKVKVLNVTPASAPNVR